ncbi:MAG: hypothetical protein Q8N05_21445 [Bacteroidota bacterium]|nr:hypothetical protein [Bacteroidota bacterium]
METIARFLEESVMGFSILGNTGQVVAKRMNNMLEIYGPSRIIELLRILNILAETNEKEKLASPDIFKILKLQVQSKLQKYVTTS